jgi:5-methylcytosine-specific restriction endonuclease McrA
MCQKCIDEVVDLKPKVKFRMSKEDKAKLPGKLIPNKLVSDMSPEEYQEHRLYARAYKKAYNDFHAANGNGTKIYQDAYQKAYKRNHYAQYMEYLNRYRKENPEWGNRSHRRRRARHAAVDSEVYYPNQIIELWGTDCYLCGEAIDLEANRGVGQIGWERGLHLDHVIPISAGGPDTVDNVRPTHGQCNLRKQSSIVVTLNDEAERVKVLFQERYGAPKKGRPRLD